ncbi:hypothetical protein CR513_57467, partial [Mucuna pruriens]
MKISKYVHFVLNMLHFWVLFVSLKGISVDEEKVKTIREWPIPKNANKKAEFFELTLKRGMNNMRKERFPTRRKCKLQPRGDGTFQVLERINDNTYKLDLSTTYGEEFDSRMNHFEEGENDRDPTNKAKNLRDAGGPMTRAQNQNNKAIFARPEFENYGKFIAK